MRLYVKPKLFSLLIGLVGCSHLGFSGDGKGVFRSSAERVIDEAPMAMALPKDSQGEINDVYMQTKADYHFTLAESHSLQDQPSKSVENYKLALVYDQDSAQIRYRLALEYVKLGLVSEAIAQCKEALDKQPQHRDSALLLGGLFSALHLFDQAMDQYERVLAHHPKDLEASLFIGALYAEQGKFKEAIRHLKKMSRQKSFKDKAQVWYYLGRIHSSKKKVAFVEAEKSFVTALKMKGDYLEAAMALGALYEQQKKFKKAKKDYANYQEEYGAHHLIAERLSQIFLAENKLDKAYEQLQLVEAYDPTNLNISLKMALLLIEQKKYDRAVNKLESILQIAPSSEKVRFYLGALYEEMKNYRAAIQQFDTIQFGSEYFEDSVMHSAYLHKLNGDYDSSIKAVERGIFHQEDKPKFWILQASLLDEQKKLEKAQVVLEKAVEKFPENIQVHFQIGSVYDRLDKKDKTVEHLEKVIALNENHVQALNYLAYVYAEGTRNLEAAEKLARKALTLQPGDGYIMDTLGWVLFKQDKVVEAIQVLEKAHSKERAESIIAEHLGDAYFRNKLPRKAKEMYLKAVGLEKNGKTKEKIQNKISSINEKLQAEKTRAKTTRLPASK